MGREERFPPTLNQSLQFSYPVSIHTLWSCFAKFFFLPLLGSFSPLPAPGRKHQIRTVQTLHLQSGFKAPGRPPGLAVEEPTSVFPAGRKPGRPCLPWWFGHCSAAAASGEWSPFGTPTCWCSRPAQTCRLFGPVYIRTCRGSGVVPLLAWCFAGLRGLEWGRKKYEQLRYRNTAYFISGPFFSILLMLHGHCLRGRGFLSHCYLFYTWPSFYTWGYWVEFPLSRSLFVLVSLFFDKDSFSLHCFASTNGSPDLKAVSFAQQWRPAQQVVSSQEREFWFLSGSVFVWLWINCSFLWALVSLYVHDSDELKIWSFF